MGKPINKKGDVTSLLREKRLRITPVRIEAAGLFLKNSAPMTIQDLYEKLKSRLKSETPDWATVYRTMMQFQESGLVVPMDLGDGVSRYEWNSSPNFTHHHHHLICTRCRSVKHLPNCDFSGLDKIAKKYRYENLMHKLEFFGICPACS